MNTIPPPFRAVTTSLGGLRLFLLLSALLLLSMATGLASRQTPKSHPLYPPTPWSSVGWWREPIELNPLQRLPALPSVARNMEFLPDNQHGWLHGADFLYVTADGGRTWADRLMPDVTDLVAVLFVDGQHGWAITGKHIYGTSTGGVEWEVQYTYPYDPTPTTDMSRLRIASATQGWAIMRGMLLHTANGLNWSSVQPIDDDVGWTDVQFIGDRGWAIGIGRTRGGNLLAQTSDGGKHWDVKEVEKTGRLMGLHFSSEQEGWLVGHRPLKTEFEFHRSALLPGVILHTSNGGGKWETVSMPDPAFALSDIVIRQQSGWARSDGDRSRYLRSADAGKSWREDDGVCGRLCFFTSPLRGWSLRGATEFWATEDGGISWYPLTMPAERSRILSITFVDEKRGWMSGESSDNRGGTVAYMMATGDGGKNWRQQTLPAIVHQLRDLQFLDALRGWAVYADGTGAGVMLTDNGGLVWRQLPLSLRTIYSAQFVDLQNGWVAGASGGPGQEKNVLMSTSNGGRDWNLLPVPAQTVAVRSMRFENARDGWALGEMDFQRGQQIFRTGDGGKNWSKLAGDHRIFAMGSTQGRIWMTTGSYQVEVRGNDGERKTLRLPKGVDLISSLYCFDAENAWIVYENGTGQRTTDGGESWSDFVVLANQEPLQKSSFVTSLHGWTIANGHMHETVDGGLKWRPVGFSDQLPAEHLVWVMNPDGHGYFVAKDTHRFQTKDGGLKWTQAGAYQRYFAPWWWAVLVLSLLLCVWALAIDPGTVSGASSIEDKLTGDGPITSADQDQLGYFRIAEGLAGFITNPATVPPFSISITGPWGKGKSSIMTLLRRRLEQWHFPIVWFNAWHHQKSEQILASLFAHIRDQAIPPLLSGRGIGFRMRLAGIRWRESGLLIPVLLLGIFVLALHVTNADRLEQWVAGLRKPNGELAWWQVVTMATVALFGGGAVLFKGLLAPLGDLFKSFGVDATSLGTSFKQLKPSSISSSPAARYRFAKDFGEVCRAYGIRQMVVFVDDIDRCDPAVVPEVLELVNFLMSSGGCYVVLGAEKKWVQAAVANAYKDIAATIALHDGGTVDAAHKEFAHRYLEKLVNLEVPVTASGDNVVKDMLKTLRDPEPQAKRWSTASLRRLVSYAPLLLAFALIIGAAGAGRMVGHMRLDPAPSPPAIAAAPMPPIAADSAPVRPCPPDSKECKDQPLPMLPMVGSTPYVGGAAGDWNFSLVAAGVAALLMALLGVLSSMRVPKFVRSDSVNFLSALVIWTDWLSERHKTPRSFKRFVNKVRFLAMLERGASAQPARWRSRWRWRSWRSQAPLPEAGAEHDKLSPAIVAYAAILSRQHGWRRHLLIDRSTEVEAGLAAAFDATGGETFQAVYHDLTSTLARHFADPGFRLPPDAPDWLPEPSLCRLIEQVVLPEPGPAAPGKKNAPGVSRGVPSAESRFSRCCAGLRRRR
jgi:photosystem II stability/assembly factor-like uncharacterized protein